MEPKNERLQIDDVKLLNNVIGLKKVNKKMSDEFGFTWSTAADCTVGTRVKEELVRDYFLKQADSYKAAIAMGGTFRE
ncbi:hypothetical protein LXL04_039848 [Taraxacum kok-saghyz]